VNRQVDPSTQERLVELAGEEALAADFVKGLVEVLVAHGPDDFKRNLGCTVGFQS
jgi:hypothetical protein